VIESAAFWGVLLASAALHWSLPPRYRPGALAAVSFAFLVTLDARSLLALLGGSLLVHALAPRTRRTGRGGWWLALGLILALLGHLAYFKYVPSLLGGAGPDGDGVYLPLGISYFTFKLIHYVVEMRRGKIDPPPLADFLLYVFLFPIFPAGPIERFDHFLDNRDPRLRRQDVAEGLTRISHGLIKKFAVAEWLILPVLNDPPSSVLLENLAETSPLRVWRHVVFLFAFAYLDFSAYTDIAVGASRLLGIRVMENFNFPFLAPNIAEFWNRWHMTLSGWCRTYVYLPMIGWSRNPYLAVFALMAAIGIWHAGTLNWLFWGLYHATGIVVYGAWSRFRRRRRWPVRKSVASRALGILITMAFVSGSYVFPATEGRGGPAAALRLFAKLFGIDL
jgi:alginate O-acetyltransferase complex protein AlgI